MLDRTLRRSVPAVLLAALAGLASCGSATSTSRGDAAAAGSPASAPAAAGGAGALAKHAQVPVAEPDVREYAQHVATLSDVFFEGRVPGSRGGLAAADYLEFYFKRYGLQPAFPADSSSGAAASFRQGFTVSGEVKVTAQQAWWEAKGDRADLKPGEDFNVLGVSATASIEGPLVFVGYSIADGPDGYSSYAAHDDLKGKIAVMLRFEPMTDEGKSKWQSISGWSQYSSLLRKLQAAEERGAAGILLVNPPGADDPRAKRLETAQGTRFGRPVKIPVVMLADAAATRLIQNADAQARSLLDLRKLADASGGVIDLPGARLNLSAGLETEQIPTHNIGGVLPGRGALADQFIVIGAHYDHLGYGHFGSRGGNDAEGVIHPGADDNASGTAGLLHLARTLSQSWAAAPKNQPTRSILFLGFSAEESGLNGSRKFVESGVIPASRITAMINMDMIGRLRDGKLEVGGVRTAEGFEDMLKPLWERAGAEGVKVTTSGGGQGPSDHASFYAANIPVLFFFTGLHEEYHKPTDVASLINAEGGVRVATLAGRAATMLADRSEGLTFRSTGTAARVGSMRGVSVRLGIAPGSYSDDQPGVVAGEVYPNTSAALGGIVKGDRLVRWGGEELADVQAMMNRLADHKPGDVVEIVVVRDGKEIPLQVKMLPRERGDR